MAISQPSELQPRRAYKPKKTLKAPAIQAKVLTHRALGTPKHKIAKELGIDKRTVNSIIDLHNFDQDIETGRALSVGLIPESIRVAKHRLSQNSENMAIKVLENTIWPLNAKQMRAPTDVQLTLAIQNLIQPQSAPASPAESTSACVPNDTAKPEQKE
jgi:hypothetical protein